MRIYGQCNKYVCNFRLKGMDDTFAAPLIVYKGVFPRHNTRGPGAVNWLEGVRMSYWETLRAPMARLKNVVGGQV